MPTFSSSDTLFAPAARLSADAIAEQVAALGDLGGLGSVLDAMPDLVMLLNRERQILFGNRGLRAFAEANGHPAFEGMRLGELLACRQAAQAPSGCGTGESCRTCGAVQAMLQGLAGKTTRLECRIVTEAHDALDISVLSSPFHRVGGDYLLVVATDISDRKRREALERLFFHDILNAAVGIHGLADILDTDADSVRTVSPMLRHSSEVLVNEIRGQQLLMAAESDELRAVPTPLRACAELVAVADLYRHHDAALGKSIVLDGVGGVHALDAAGVAASDFAFTSDAAMLQRVLGNLLKNALEASRPGAVVHLGAHLAEGEARFTCHNDGFIPRATQLQIFRRNFSTKGPGRGIGTFGARLLTERYLGGQLSFTSTPDEGTTFQVALPLTLPPSPPLAPPPS